MCRERPTRIGICWLALLAASGCRAERGSRAVLPVEPEPSRVVSDTVWVASDSEPAASVRDRAADDIALFGLPGETVAFQVAVQAGPDPLAGVSVELEPFAGPSPAGIRTQRFVVVDLPMPRRSGGKTPGESLGWMAGAAPPAPAAGGALPDPLIPVELAPAWADYPMRVTQGAQRVVWIDVTLAERGLEHGEYHSRVLVTRRAPDGGTSSLRDLPLRLEVGRAALPYAPLRTMVFFEPDTLARTVDEPGAVDQLQQTLHAHQLSTVFPINGVADVTARSAALTGALYTRERGYGGPGRGVGASVVAIGAYGSLGDPDPSQVRVVEQILESLERLGVRDRPGLVDVFLYAVDEECRSQRGPRWKAALLGSALPAARQLRVAHSCAEPPATQPVDLVLLPASHYAPNLVAKAQHVGKRVWIYNGVLPHTGTFLTDAWRTSLRANAWIQFVYGIERWFYWESTFWRGNRQTGRWEHDLFASAETFRNDDGDHCNGDGVLVYPGVQRAFGARSVGYSGVFPSIRLKLWRRGISDAGYLQLARYRDPERTRAILRRIVPRALDAAPPGPRPPWATSAADYEAARRKLFEMLR